MNVFLMIDKRDFTRGWNAFNGEWQVEQMSWRSLGGPEQASLSREWMPGEAGDWEDLLRRPVEAFGLDGELLWWGYISGVSMEHGGALYRRSLDGLRSTVIYRWDDGWGEQTAQASDSASVELYGTKELYLDLGQTSSSRAAAEASAQLRNRCTTAAAWQAQSPAAAGKERIRLELRGWWETLGWAHFFYSGQGSAAATPNWSQNDSAALGNTASATKGLQVLIDDHGEFPDWNAVQLEMWVCAVGSPADSLRIALYALDANNLPTGSPLDSVDLAVNWTALAAVRVTLNKTARLTPGRAYGVQFSRTGAVSSASYYKIGLNAPAAGTAYKTWNGTSWVQRVPAASALVRLSGVVEAAQLAAFHAGSGFGGQFLTGTLVEASSSVEVGSQTDQPRTHRAEIEALLAAGSTAERRLLAEITPGRKLRIYPVTDECRLVVLADGQARGPGGLLPNPLPALGKWVRLAGLPGVPLVRVERVRWDGAAWKLN